MNFRICRKEFPFGKSVSDPKEKRVGRIFGFSDPKEKRFGRIFGCSDPEEKRLGPIPFRCGSERNSCRMDSMVFRFKIESFRMRQRNRLIDGSNVKSLNFVSYKAMIKESHKIMNHCEFNTRSKL